MSQESRKHPNEVLIEKLMVMNEQLTQQCSALAAIVVASLGQVNPGLFLGSANGTPQAYYPQDEIKEDADALLEAGLIDTTEYAEYLKRAGFSSANVDIVS